MLDFSDLPKQNETAIEAKPASCKKCLAEQQRAGAVNGDGVRKAEWRVLNKGSEVGFVCTPHKHDYLFPKGRMYKPVLGFKFERYAEDDGPRFFGGNPLYRFKGHEMRKYTKKANAAGVPLVFEKRKEGANTYYVSKGVTKKMMEA